MAVPLLDDYKIDEDNLARFALWLAGCRGVTAVMTNGHTGEVGSLLPDERATVTRVVADAVKGAGRVISALCAEGTLAAVDRPRAAPTSATSARCARTRPMSRCSTAWTSISSPRSCTGWTARSSDAPASSPS